MPLSGEQVISVLRQAGFERVSQRGSHVKLRHPDGRTAIVPLHKELAPGTFASVLRQAGISGTEFDRLTDGK